MHQQPQYSIDVQGEAGVCSETLACVVLQLVLPNGLLTDVGVEWSAPSQHLLHDDADAEYI